MCEGSVRACVNVNECEYKWVKCACILGYKHVHIYTYVDLYMYGLLISLWGPDNPLSVGDKYITLTGKRTYINHTSDRGPIGSAWSSCCLIGVNNWAFYRPLGWPTNIPVWVQDTIVSCTLPASPNCYPIRIKYVLFMSSLARAKYRLNHE